MTPAENPPLTAAGLASAVMGLVAAFTSASGEQVAAIGAAVSIVAAFVAQRYTRSKASLRTEGPDLAALTDAQQAQLLAQTDNRGPRDPVVQPQEPDSAVDA